MFTRLDYSSALEYSIIRRYTNNVYYYYYYYYSLKNNCLFIHFSNHHFMKFNYIQISIILKIIFYFNFPLSYMCMHIPIV